MKKYKASSSVDCIYMETMLNKQMRSNIRMIQDRQMNPTQTPKPMSQNQSRRIVKATKEPQQLIIQLQDNKILMSQLCQPVVIHSHRITSSNKHSTLESPKFKRTCLHLDNPQNKIKHQHYLKKGGQVQYPPKETKSWYPFARIKRKQLLTSFIDQKQAQINQNNLIITHFQSMADLTGWQTNEDPQMELQ
ncbi:unnamed protein product (macronuclear) [Paramecium tetraurelia]|uniref:Uncharacterized protein n=1 Tax=Paramecium tetraurelia TaxID=5888 RepID=A0C3A0_PARTE|nr:uncharacterized protein GSPATT00034746001 [Paramecium tetraurelia]CAK65267.1 unnamed protein product [Paramecium tetraurelia]|eukprot:XP_001432664.1 hypothetical protein (macronuclear) [Paramecium tetraurelia strain d4-2]